MGNTEIAVALDQQVLKELVQHIQNNTTDQAESNLIVPTSHFTSPERLAAEIRLLKSKPVIVGHVSDIPDPGSFFTREFLGIPLLVVRQQNGSVAVFRNMCRHRGGRVEDAPSGKRQLFMCQYHGWSYAAESGELKAVPYEQTAGKIDKSCMGLLSFPCEVRHGLIFATLSGDRQAPIADFLGSDIDRQIAPWQLEQSSILIDETVTLDVNWKLVLDGTVDSLHAQFLHPKPGGVGSRSINHCAVFREYRNHGKMFMARKKLRTVIEDQGPEMASSKYVGTVMMIYPNNVFVEAPEHVELWSVWPCIDNPAKCTVRFRFLVRDELRTPELEARVHKSWDILRHAGMEEDFPMEESIQVSARAWPEGTFMYGRNEKPAQHLHRQLHMDIDAGKVGADTITFE